MCKKCCIDHLVIGAGIGGTYLTARLSKKFPNDKVLLVDKLDDFGGLMTSYHIPGTTTTLDLGPVRFF